MALRACTDDAHCALFYNDAHERRDGIARFLEPAVRGGDPVAVCLPAAGVDPVIEHIDALGVSYELLVAASNPARIIPAVGELLERQTGRTLHYIEEPIWPGRPSDESWEAARHEGLVNLAWPGAAIRVLCLYDAQGLEPDLLAAAEATHPTVVREGHRELSRSFEDGEVQLPGGELHPPPDDAEALCFDRGHLAGVRRLVRERGERGGLPPQRADDLVLAVDELASNTIRYARGRGRLRVWHEQGRIVCEVQDPGRIRDPLAGRRRPGLAADGGVGLWAVNQLCDLVQLRSDGDGTVVRVHMALR